MHLHQAMKRGVSVCVLIQEPRDWNRRHEAALAAADDAKLKLIDAAVELLQSLGIHVTLRPKMHEKLIVIDDRILWEGSMNMLSWFNTTERYRRFSDRAEVAHAIEKHKLLPCRHCVVPTISEVLSASRLSLGLTQHDVARMAGVHRRVILECEAGKRNTRMGNLERICDALGFEVQIIPEHLGQTTQRLVRDGLPKVGQTKNSRLMASNHHLTPTISESDHHLTPTISETLKHVRSSLGLTQQDVATMASLDRKLVRECESGKRDVRLESLKRICGALGLEVQAIPKHLAHFTRQLV